MPRKELFLNDMSEYYPSSTQYPPLFRVWNGRKQLSQHNLQHNIFLLPKSTQHLVLLNIQFLLLYMVNNFTNSQKVLIIFERNELKLILTIKFIYTRIHPNILYKPIIFRKSQRDNVRNNKGTKFNNRNANNNHRANTYLLYITGV